MASGVEKHNSVLRRATKRAWELEPKLAAILEPILKEAGELAAAQFLRYAQSLTASGPPEGPLAAPDGLLSSAPGVTSYSTMIALLPRASEQEALEHDHDGATPAWDIHVTLCYLGEYDGDLEDLAALLRPLAGTHAPMTGKVAGVGAFEWKPGEPRPNIMLPSVPGLVELRVDVTGALDHAGVTYSRDYGYVPHLTSGYTDTGEPPSSDPLGQPLHFDSLWIVRGDTERVEIPFTGSPPLTAAGGPSSWVPPASSQLVDVEALVASLRTKTDPVRLAVIEATMKKALEEHGIEWDVTNPLTQKVLAHAGEQITNIAETTQLNVTRIVKEAYEQGLSIPDTATAIKAGMSEASTARATLIARTELVGAVNGGSLAATQIVSDATGIAMQKQWLTAPGAPNPRHELYEGLNGQQVPLDAFFQVGADQLGFPGDPGGSPEEVCNCFPATTSVVASDVQMGFRRRYEGDLVRVEVVGVGDLSGTPNHPVLTSAGWKPLGDLREGDHLVCAVPCEDEGAVYPNVDDGPAAIHQVFGALARRQVPRRIGGRAVEFHGDASADGKVDVVAADSYLRGGGGSSSGQKVGEFEFAGTGEATRLLSPDGSAFDLVVVDDSGPARVVRSRGEGPALGGREVRHALTHRVGTASGGDADVAERANNDGSADAVALGERLYGSAFVVSLAKVCAVERYAFHGDVFNLQTESGTYLANHIVVHNCRCTIIYTEGGGVVAQGDAEDGLSPDDAVAAAEEDLADESAADEDAGGLMLPPDLGETGAPAESDGTAIYEGGSVEHFDTFSAGDRAILDGVGENNDVDAEYRELHQKVNRLIESADWSNANADAHVEASHAADRVGVDEVRVLKNDDGNLLGIVDYNVPKSEADVLDALADLQWSIDNGTPWYGINEAKAELEKMLAVSREKNTVVGVNHLASTGEEKGVGARMMQIVARDAAREGRGVGLNSLSSARGFYERLGMVEREPGNFYWTPQEAKEFAETGRVSRTEAEKVEGVATTAATPSTPAAVQSWLSNAVEEPAFLKLPEFQSFDGVGAFDFAPTTELNVSDLTATQPSVEWGYAATADTAEAVDVVKYGDRYYVWDGNHRVGAAIANGEKTINARVLDAGSPASESLSKQIAETNDGVEKFAGVKVSDDPYVASLQRERYTTTNKVNGLLAKEKRGTMTDADRGRLAALRKRQEDVRGLLKDGAGDPAAEKYRVQNQINYMNRLVRSGDATHETLARLEVLTARRDALTELLKTSTVKDVIKETKETGSVSRSKQTVTKSVKQRASQLDANSRTSLSEHIDAAPDGIVELPAHSFQIGGADYRMEKSVAFKVEGVVVKVELAEGSRFDEVMIRAARTRLQKELEEAPLMMREQLDMMTVARGYSPNDAYWQKQYPGFTHAAAQGGGGQIWFWSGHDSIEQSFKHELGHVVGWSGGPRFEDDWRAAGMRDKKSSARKFDDDSGFSLQGRNFQINRSAVTTYAANAPAEDWAESIRLWLIDRADGSMGMAAKDGQPVRVRFADVYPSRDKLIRKWLKVDEWGSASGGRVGVDEWGLG